jgi:hypothetical protein
MANDPNPKLHEAAVLDIVILDFGLVWNLVLRISNFGARKNREQNSRFRPDNGLKLIGRHEHERS